MKRSYLVIITFFIVYIANIFLDYSKERDSLFNKEGYSSVKSISLNSAFDKDAYIFNNDAWDIERKVKVQETKDENISDISKVLPIKVDLNKSPITICAAEECYEFIGIKNNRIVFYGKSNEKDRFFDLSVGNKLGNRIKIKNKNSKKIEFFDLDLNQTFFINTFDVNVSMYKPEERENKDEK